MQLFFGGDVCVSGSFAKALESEKCLIGPHLQQILSQADACVYNLEGAILPPSHAGAHLSIQNPASILSHLGQWGNPVFTLANNHIADAGGDTLSYTCQQIEIAGFEHLGTGRDADSALKPLIMDSGTVRVALIAMTFVDERPKAASHRDTAARHVAVPPSPNRMRKLIAELKKDVDHVILSFHGEEEYVRQPWPRRRKQFHQWASMGVSAIIGHHPHVAQGWEMVGKVPVFYSLGNFLFDRPHHHKWQYTDEGLGIALRFDQEHVAVATYPILLDRDCGQVELHPHGHVPQMDTSLSAWQAECYRVLYQGHIGRSEESREPVELSPQPSRANTSRRIPRFFRRSFYRMVWAYLRHANSRAILWGALLHRLSTRS